jgi:hypothetical protein
MVREMDGVDSAALLGGAFAAWLDNRTREKAHG